MRFKIAVEIAAIVDVVINVDVNHHFSASIAVNFSIIIINFRPFILLLLSPSCSDYLLPIVYEAIALLT